MLFFCIKLQNLSGKGGEKKEKQLLEVAPFFNLFFNVTNTCQALVQLLILGGIQNVIPVENNFEKWETFEDRPKHLDKSSM